MNKINNSKKITFYQITNAISKEKKNLEIIVVFFIIIGILYAFLAPKWYRVEIKILPTNNEDNMVLREYASIAALAGVNIPTGGASYHYFYPDIIKSNFVLERLLKKKFWISTKHDSLTLIEFWGIKIDTTKKNWKIKLFEKAKRRLRNSYIKVKMDELTQMVKLEVSAPTEPSLSKDIANYIIDQLDIYNRTRRKTNAHEQKLFIEKAISANKDTLNLLEKKLVNFENENKKIIAPEKKVEYERLKNNVEIFRNILNELKNKLELIKIEEIKQTPTLNIIEKAETPYYKEKPKRLIIILLFLFIGILLALIYAILKNNWVEIKKNIKKGFDL